MPLTITGYTPIRAEDFLADMRADIEGLAGLSIDWGRDTFLGPLTAVVANRLGNLSSENQAIYDARSPNNATGVPLSDLSQISGIDRQNATFSVLPVALTGTAGTVILEGDFRIRVNDADWVNVADGTVDGAGDLVLVMRAVEAGPTTAAQGLTTSTGVEILTPTLGITEVTTGIVVVGQNVENDAELALRRVQSLQIRGSTAAAAIRARILEALVNVTGALVFENDSDVPVIQDGVNLDANSIAVIVNPALATSDEEETLAALLYERVTSGIKMMGSVTKTITGPGLSERTAAWDNATEVDVAVTMVIRMEVATPGQDEPPVFADVQAPIQDAVDALSFALGADFLTLDASRVADSFDGVRSVTSVTLASVPADPGRVDVDGNLTIGAAEIIGTITCTVTEAP